LLYRRADTPVTLQQSFCLFIVVKLSVDVDNDVIRLALWTKNTYKLHPSSKRDGRILCGIFEN